MFTRHTPHKATLDMELLASEVVKLTAGEAASRKIRVQIESSRRCRGLSAICPATAVRDELAHERLRHDAEVKSDDREVTIRYPVQKRPDGFA